MCWASRQVLYVCNPHLFHSTNSLHVISPPFTVEVRHREAEELTSGHTADNVDPGLMPGMAGSLCALEYSIQCILTASTLVLLKFVFLFLSLSA